MYLIPSYCCITGAGSAKTKIQSNPSSQNSTSYSTCNLCQFPVSFCHTKKFVSQWVHSHRCFKVPITLQINTPLLLHTLGVSNNCYELPSSCQRVSTAWHSHQCPASTTISTLFHKCAIHKAMSTHTQSLIFYKHCNICQYPIISKKNVISCLLSDSSYI